MNRVVGCSAWSGQPAAIVMVTTDVVERSSIRKHSLITDV